MKFSFFKLLFLMSFLHVGETEASSADIGRVGDCKESLRSIATPLKRMTGISVYRLFNKYPPVGLREVQLEEIYGSLKNKIKGVDISSDCFRDGVLVSAIKWHSDSMRKIVNEDVVPLHVYSGESGYLMVFLYPGYKELDGTGEEVSAGMATYDADGELLKVVERVSTWANNEGTLVLRDSCLTEFHISTSEIRVDPFERQESGEVIVYDPPFELSRNMDGIFGNKYSTSGGYECLASSYIKLNKK